MKKNVDKLVGRNEDGVYYWLDYVFKDKDFQGTVGTMFRPVSKFEKENTMSLDAAVDRFEDCWREAVQSGNTEEGLVEYAESIIRWDRDEAFFDLSDYDAGCEVAEMYNSELSADADEGDKAEFSECIGGGRCFCREIKWAKIYDEKALKLALEYEKD